MTAHHVVIGASAAGVAASIAMRATGFTGRISLVDGGAHAPYERPPLSKSFTELDPPRPILPAEAYRANDIDLVLGTAVRDLDPGTRTVLLADGRSLTADAVLLATGVLARRLCLPGEALSNVLTLRDVDDARRIAGRLDAGGPLVVVGGGFIGLEAAAVARSRGLPVTVVEVQPVPLLAALGRQVGSLVRRLHEDRGVRVVTGRTVVRFLGSTVVEQVLLDDGELLAAATVLVGCGVVPNDELARRAGVHCAAGVLVDAHGRTDVPWIWAAGDVARQPHPHVVGAQRIEHWDVAQRHGAAVGASMAGVPAVNHDVPYFWSDQYGLRMQMYGRGAPGDTIVLRDGATPERLLAFWLRDDKLVAAAAVDNAKDLRAVKALIEKGSVVPVAALTDPATSLRSLGRAAIAAS